LAVYRSRSTSIHRSSGLSRCSWYWTYCECKVIILFTQFCVLTEFIYRSISQKKESISIRTGCCWSGYTYPEFLCSFEYRSRVFCCTRGQETQKLWQTSGYQATNEKKLTRYFTMLICKHQHWKCSWTEFCMIYS
jgi:hypothetical protein